jgi:phosphate transport system substrate-binding protein
MTKHQSNLGLIIVMILSVFALLTGCGTPTPAPTEESVSGNITFAGSTTVQPLAAAIGEAYNEEYPEVALDISAGGSSVGIKAIHDGTVDIGMASRELKPEEEENITKYQVSVDVIAMVVQSSNPVETLSLDQLRAIYHGDITNWREVGGPDQDILVVVRDKNSGTRGAFDDIVLDGDDPAAPNLFAAITAGDVAAKVLEEENAIGYVGFGNLEEGLKPLTINDVEPSEKTAQDGSYKLVRPLYLLTGPLSQPLAQTYIDFALSDEGQQVVKENGWVPMK